MCVFPVVRRNHGVILGRVQDSPQFIRPLYTLYTAWERSSVAVCIQLYGCCVSMHSNQFGTCNFHVRCIYMLACVPTEFV